MLKQILVLAAVAVSAVVTLLVVPRLGWRRRCFPDPCVRPFAFANVLDSLAASAAGTSPSGRTGRAPTLSGATKRGASAKKVSRSVFASITFCRLLA